MVSLAARAAGWTAFWFGTFGLANGIEQVLLYPYWYPSAPDRFAYLIVLFAVYAAAGLAAGVGMACVALLLARRDRAAPGAASLAGLAAAFVFWAGFWIHRDFVARSFSARGLAVTLALACAGAVCIRIALRLEPARARTGRALAAVPAVFLLIGLAVAARGSSGTRAPEGGPNILLLVIDTLRADRLSCYGNPRPASGAIDRLARDGVLFAETIAPAPLTQPSVATILTGLYPAAAGVVNHPNRLEEGRSTLAEILCEAGYRTAFANPHPLLTPAWGFDRGWDEYRYLHKPSRFEASLLADLLRRLRLRDLRTGYQADTVTDFAIDVLSRNRSEPFFLYAHYLDPHFPYVPPRPFDRLFADAGKPRLLDERLPDGRRRIFSIDASPGEMEETVALYDAEIAFTSREVGRLLSALDRLGLSDRTLVALTADHGESLGEQGLFFAHTHYLYDPTQHVPLILRFPNRFPRGKIIEAQAGLADLAPTLLDAAGIRAPEEMEGQSLLPLLRGEETEGRFAFAENGERSLEAARRRTRDGSSRGTRGSGA